MLTATVSHDMRTPLNAITGISHNLQNLVNGEQGQKLLKIINNSSRILLFLVNDLLDFFQIKNGKFNLSFAPVDIKKSVMEILDMFEIPAEAKGLKLLHSFDEKVPNKVNVDEQRIRQVLLNLISNAMKFTQKGSITIEVGYDEPQRLLKFAVKDTGIGIGENDQSKLFKLFGKLQSSHQLNKAGIGLGLYICKKIVD